MADMYGEQKGTSQDTRARAQVATWFSGWEKSIGAGCAHQDLRHHKYTLCPKSGSVTLPNLERGHEAVECP